jgi:hypothetical protein
MDNAELKNAFDRKTQIFIVAEKQFVHYNIYKNNCDRNKPRNRL